MVALIIIMFSLLVIMSFISIIYTSFEFCFKSKTRYIMGFLTVMEIVLTILCGFKLTERIANYGIHKYICGEYVIIEQVVDKETVDVYYKIVNVDYD